MGRHFKPNMAPLADRNIDAFLLTTNSTDVMSRATVYESGGLSVPLDGLFTQAGEVYFKFTVSSNPVDPILTFSFRSSTKNSRLPSSSSSKLISVV